MNNDFNEEIFNKVNNEIKQAIDSGVPVVDINIFDHLDKLKISKQNIVSSEYTLELYEELVNKLYTMDQKIADKYLLQLKNTDIIDNQSLEKEDSFLISLYKSFEKKAAIDFLIENYGKELNKNKLVDIHDNVLRGTSSSKKKGLRTDNFKFVGSWENGERKIQYFPILYTQIDEAIDKFLEFYNSNINNLDKEYDIFVKPIIYHGLLAALQLFNDGNTRFARLIQNVEIWGLMNNKLDKSIKLPILYATKQYFPYRNEYRNLIKNIAIYHDEDSWNKWISFNLKRFQESLYVGDDRLNFIKKMK